MSGSNQQSLREFVTGPGYIGDRDEILPYIERIEEQLETYRAALEEIAAMTPFSPPNENGVGRAHHVARAVLYPAREPSPQAGDLLVMPHAPGDPVPVGWTVEGDKMWRRADGTEAQSPAMNPRPSHVSVRDMETGEEVDRMPYPGDKGWASNQESSQP